MSSALLPHVPVGQVAPPEAERQVDTAVDWGRGAKLFDYDADDACFVRVGEAGP